jgi:tripartite-type tricarboxylate transporter receptor subunit TctC
MHIMQRVKLIRRRPGYKAVLWNSLMAPKGTDPAIVNKLANAVKAVLANPETKKMLESQGTQVVGSTPALNGVD